MLCHHFNKTHLVFCYFTFLLKTQDHTTEGPQCDITEKQIFTMGGQIASALVSFCLHEPSFITVKPNKPVKCVISLVVCCHFNNVNMSGPLLDNEGILAQQKLYPWQHWSQECAGWPGPHSQAMGVGSRLPEDVPAR